jgi:hypothetical protein
MRAAALAIVIGCLGGWSDGGAALRVPTRVQIVSQEFTLTPSRHRLKSGSAIVELYNLGEDEHDLVIARRGTARRIARIQPLRSHTVANTQIVLRPGRYLLWCSLADHRERGMETQITVLSPRAARR